MPNDPASSTRRAAHPLIVCYYTPGTAYEAHAMTLREDTRRLGLAARIEPRAARGSWVENCAQKAGFIRELHLQERRPLLWIDADARLRRPLRVLEGISADLAVVRQSGWKFLTGQIYFGAGPGASRLLDLWCEYCSRFPHVWDQVSLGYAWWELSLETPVEALWLSRLLFQRQSRSFIGRWRQRLLPLTPILHQQESRRSKAKLGEAARPEFGSDDVPLWWRKAAARNAPFPLDAAQRVALGLR